MMNLFSFERISGNSSVRIGAAGAFLVIALAIVGPWITPYDVSVGRMTDRVGDRLLPPSLLHPFGTDHLGTDLLSLVMAGARQSLFIGLGAATICTLLGLAAGMAAGLMGGTIDMVIVQVIDVFLAFPSLILAILIAASLGPGYISIVLALVLSGWPALARMFRSVVISIRQEEYILAAIVSGCSSSRLVIRHVLPNCLPLVIVLFTLRVGMMILAESSLSFLGLGSPAGTASWGVMVDIGRSYIGSAPWCSIAPASAIAFTVLSFSFLGDGLRDMLDPKLRGRI